MKKPILYFLLAFALTACNSKTPETTASADTTVAKTPEQKVADTTFDVNNILISDKDLGTFPYFSPPPTYSYNYHSEAQAGNIKAVDREYFAVNGKLIMQEGKTFKINVEKIRSDGPRFSDLEVLKYYEGQIAALGGIQVNDAEITQAEYDRIGEKELIGQHYGYTLDQNLLDRIKTYVIRTKDKIVWIQLCLLNDESGRMAILEQLVGTVK